MSKLSLIPEFWEFLKIRKKFWLLPIIIPTASYGIILRKSGWLDYNPSVQRIIIILFLLGALIIFTETSAVAPFIYTLF